MGLVLGVQGSGGIWDCVLNCLDEVIALCCFDLVGVGLLSVLLSRCFDSRVFSLMSGPELWVTIA